MLGQKKELYEYASKIDCGANQKVQFEFESSNKMLEKHETHPHRCTR